MLEGDKADSGAVYACGPPAMLEAVREMCARAGVVAELAMEAPMACGFGACFGCAVPLSGGGYMRLCVDGPVVDAARIATALVPGSGHSMRMDLSVELCGLRLEHPVLNGSGTFDAIAARRAFGEALLDDFPFSAFVSKTITPEPRAGNPPPRIFETPSGMINSIGLPNKGLDGFLDQDLPILAELPVPLVVSVMGTSHGEFARLVEGVADRAEVAALELNVSCPNVESGLIIGQQPEETLALTEALRPLTAKPLIVKLTPNVAEPATVARAAEEGGADAVSLVNTLGPPRSTRRPSSRGSERDAGASRGRRSGPSRWARCAMSLRRSPCR